MEHSRVKQRQRQNPVAAYVTLTNQSTKICAGAENLLSAREHIPRRTGGFSYKNIVILSTESVLQPASHYSTTPSGCIFPEMPDEVTTKFADFNAEGFN